MSMFIAPEATNGGDFTLSDGCYPAIVVGLRGFMGSKYQQPDVKEPKLQFVFQVQDDEGTLHYVATKPLSNKLNDRSNLFKVLNGITGYGIDHFPKGFQYTQFVNSDNPIKCQLVIKTVDSKKDPNKKFNEIQSILKAKANQSNAFVPDDQAPAWLNQNCLETLWINSLGFQAPKEPVAARDAMPEVPSTVQLGDQSVFFGQGNAQFGVTQQAQAYVPPMTKQQQQAYLAQQAQQQQAQTYVPPAAPAPQPTWPAPQAPQVAADSDEGLPF